MSDEDHDLVRVGLLVCLVVFVLVGWQLWTLVAEIEELLGSVLPG